MTLCVYINMDVFQILTRSNSIETKSWRALENNAISLQYNEIYEGRTGVYNVVYRRDYSVNCLDLQQVQILTVLLHLGTLSLFPDQQG